MNAGSTADSVALAPAAEDFSDFFRAEFTSMVALAHGVCGDRSAAEDIAAEALSRANDKWDTVSGYDKPGAWLRRVTINLARSHGRRLGTRERFLRRQRSEPTVAAPTSDHELWDAVRTLPDKQRSAIVLRYLEDLPVAEIAEILGCTASTAGSHLQKARTRLAEILQSDASNEGGRR